MALLAVLMAPFLVVTMGDVLAYAPADRKWYARAALVFMTLFAGITSAVNFALLVVTRRPVADSPPWLSLFLPYQWPTLAYATVIFAWGWFCALSLLFAAPAFREGRLEKLVRVTMIISGGLSLLGFIVLPFSAARSIRIGILGWGVTGPIVFLLLALVFVRTRPAPSNSAPNRPAQSGS